MILDISLEITIEEITGNSATNFKSPVISARRFGVKGDNGNVVPSFTIQLRFDGQEVPGYVCLFHMRIKVHLYNPQPRICYNCYIFDHVASQCK